jgi:hypothetical protein
MLFLFALFILVIQVKSADPFTEDGIVYLDPASVWSRLEKGEKMILFIGVNWCGYCRRATPEWKNALQMIKEKNCGANLPIYKVKCDSDPKCEGFKVIGYPTMRVYTGDKFEDYHGERNTQGLFDFWKHQLDLKC